MIFAVSSSPTTPVLGRWTVDGFLGGGVGVYGSHETLNDGVFVVDDLGQWSQAVCGARGIGDNIDIRLVCLLVDSHDIHGRLSAEGAEITTFLAPPLR